MEEKKSIDYSTSRTSTVLSNLTHQDQETQLDEIDKEKPLKQCDSETDIFKEIAIQSIDLNVATCSNRQSQFQPISLVSKVSVPVDCRLKQTGVSKPSFSCNPPIIVINSPTNRSPITIQASGTFQKLGFLDVPPTSVIRNPNQPQTLFIQALAKLNQSSISLAILNKVGSFKIETNSTTAPAVAKSPELSPPNSLTSAPPSYSFVLRQSAARRRPRLMGTFIPSPSFVLRTPPPNYAAAFDIYVDSPLPPQPARVYNFGFASMPVICPECGYAGLTAITTKITLCTHLCALLLCLFCCWVCAPLPYILRSCKDVYHYCRNCRNFLGMYSPSNPETAFPGPC